MRVTVGRGWDYGAYQQVSRDPETASSFINRATWPGAHFRGEMTKLEEAQSLFDSIICLCVEGREVAARKHLLDAIQKDAEKGYEVTKEKD